MNTPTFECISCGALYEELPAHPCTTCNGVVVNVADVIGACVRHYNVAQWLVKIIEVNARPMSGPRPPRGGRP